MDITFHYPPELFQLLVDTLPRLSKSKKDLLLLFRGAGIDDPLLEDLRRLVAANPSSIHKAEITRRILTRLNERGEAALRERRELLKRVVEFEDFSTCWPDNQAAAKGYVADVRRIIGIKDAFTRMQQERDRERQAHIKQREVHAEAQRQRSEARAKLRKELAALFKDDLDPHRRGNDFEAILNRLFQLDGILLRESFRRKGEEGKIIEQIDGAVEIGSNLYLVEAKWRSAPVDVQDVQVLLSRLFIRPGARGILVSASGYTGPAITLREQAASQKVLLLITLSEMLQVLSNEDSIGTFIKERADLAVMALL